MRISEKQRQAATAPLMAKCLFNYRILFAYFMATTFVFMHYMVSSSSGSNELDKRNVEPNAAAYHHDEQQQAIINNNNFNSKKLLNIEAPSYDLPATFRRHGRRHRRHLVVTSRRLDRLLASVNAPLVVSKLVIDPPPPTDFQPYNLRNQSARFYSQILQDRILMHLLGQAGLSVDNRLFVEAGAYDGQFITINIPSYI